MSDLVVHTLNISSECWKVQVMELFLVINVKANWWPGYIWWVTTPLLMYQEKLGYQLKGSCVGIMFIFNISAIIAREVWQIKTSPTLTRAQSMFENQTVRLWIFTINFQIVLICLSVIPALVAQVPCLELIGLWSKITKFFVFILSKLTLYNY